MIKLVIFDAGGVFLHEPGNNNGYIFREMAQACNVDYSAIEQAVNPLIPFYQRGDINDNKFWEEFKRLTGATSIPENHSELWTRPFLTNSRIDNQVLDLIQRLRGNGYKTAVLSNTVPPHARVNRERGLFKQFEPVILSCEVGCRKPEEAIYKLTAEKANVLPEECIFVDDISKYVAAAQNTGMLGIVYKNVSQLESELREKGVDV